jgi:DNA-binding transcriptional MerR regulator/methylmalonyl-CoA mutase cobalamin-binding subunit
MYTIKQAARLTGVNESLLRAWERRYGVVAPRRSESGYRLYDPASLETVLRMRRLVAAGWPTAEAARAVRSGTVTPSPQGDAQPIVGPTPPGETGAAAHREQFLTSAALMDAAGTEESLDRGWSLGSFEHVVDSWLFPTLEALGDGWARGEIDVAGEHAASHAVHRRLAAAFEAAGSRSRGLPVVVGLPPGSRHELGGLAFATALRRRGLDVLYLGADVPVSSWQSAVARHAARAAVLSVVMPEDRPPAVTVVERLQGDDSGLLVAAGGRSGDDLARGVRTLGPGIGAAAQELDELLHGERAD